MDNSTFDWTAFCPTGFSPYDNSTNTLATCFQIYVEIPVFAFLASASAYHIGFRGENVQRDAKQVNLIVLRMLIDVILALEPMLKLIYLLVNGMTVFPAFAFLVFVEFTAWCTHFCHLLVMLKNGTIRHSGPLSIIVLWATIFALKLVSLETNYGYDLWQFPAVNVIFLILFGCTLYNSGSASVIHVQEQQGESDEAPLVTNEYSRFPEYDHALGPAQDHHNFISKIFFFWVNPLIKKGVANLLQKNEDLFDLPDCLNVNLLAKKLHQSLRHNGSLFFSLHRAFGLEFYFIGIFRLIADLSGFAGPLLLGGLLSTTENSSDDDFELNSYKYAAGLLGTTLLSAFAGVHFNWRISIVSMKMRTSLITAIYRKGLEAKELKDATPEILNLMSTDTDRIVNSCISFHSLWSIPFQLFTSLYLLYTQVGLAFLTAVIFAVCLIPINRYVANKIGEVSTNLMSAKDERVSVTSECLNGAKQIKLQSWEDFWINRIVELREKEVKYLAQRKYLDALCVYFWATTPVLMCLLTFGTQALNGTFLNASKTYTAVALLNMLIGPLNAFPWVLNGLMEAWVSLKRVQGLIDLNNIDYAEYYNCTRKFNQRAVHPVVVFLEDCQFEYDKPDRTNQNQDNNQEDEIRDFKLQGVNLQILKGELVVVEGRVGSGKTTLVNGIIGNSKKTFGQLYVAEQEKGFGYVAQSTWLQRGTIRDNILWGSVYDDKKYQEIIEDCALKEDLEVLGGDLTGVGEGGRTLSGGQRSRVALARAIYQEKEINIFDDFLSALDAHVATHIIKNVILKRLSKKTLLIVTENRSIVDIASQIVTVENGTVTFIDLMNETRKNDHDWNTPRKVSRPNLGVPRNNPNPINVPDEDQKSLDSIMQMENREYGHLDSSVLSFYFGKAMRSSVTTFVFLSVFFMQLSKNVSDAWLAFWVSETNVPKNGSNFTDGFDSESEHNTSYYLQIFTALSLSNSVLTLIRAFLFAWAGIQAAKKIHELLLNSVIYTKLSFFDITPLGRLLNRFSSDTYTVDDSLPFIFNIFLAQIFALLGALFVTIYAMPWIIILVIPLIPIYLNLQSKYRNASRDIKRLASVALSPLYAQFTETLQGLATIRGMRAVTRFRQDFSVKVENSIRAQVTSSAAQQWLALRLQILGGIIVGGAGFLTALTSAHTKHPGLVGLAISYALSISSLLGGVLNAFAETEQELIAVERISQYCDLVSEHEMDGTTEPPFGWPFQGVICFRNVFLSYRESLGNALKEINFETTSYEKVGIVGRTGAGKSSIFASLLRVAPINEGEILIDYVDINTLPLNTLRKRVSIVSQDPFLFKGTVRQNLDPYEMHLDSEIWTALTNCLIGPLVQNLGGLYGKIEVGGSNLSAGQKQLLCLSRALLKSSKIVLIDEGTSNLDNDTEMILQLVLKNAFKTSTVLIIAHRLNGLQNVDRMIVIDNGKIAEMGPPQELASFSDSLLSKMLDEQRVLTFRK